MIRFPFVAMRHGGGVFLVPYTVSLLLLAIAQMSLELVAGQTVRARCKAAGAETRPQAQLGIAGLFAKARSSSLLLGAVTALPLVTLCCYRSVMLGWTLQYLVRRLGRVRWAGR